MGETWIGVDLHLRTATACRYEDGRLGVVRLLKLHGPEWERYWQAAPREADVVVEMGRTTWWFARWVQERGLIAHVIDPVRSRAMAAGRPKTDRCDARWLAEMGAKGVLHEVYVIRPETERLRELLRHRSTWVRDRTRVKNRIHYQLAHEQVVCPHRSVFSQRGQRWLDTVHVSAPYNRSLDNHRAHYAFVQTQVDQTTEAVLSHPLDEDLVRRLESIPGIGSLTARTLIAEIETIYRFPTPEHLISYAGLAPRVRQSSTQDRRGPLTKRGSVWLRTALVEAAQVAVRHPNQFQRVFRRVAFRRGRNVGIVAAGRRLAAVIWHVWWKGRSYEEPQGVRPQESAGVTASVATA